MKQHNFRRNDIVRTNVHERLMVVKEYHKMHDGTEKVVVTEGGYHNEEDLTLILRITGGR